MPDPMSFQAQRYGGGAMKQADTRSMHEVVAEVGELTRAMHDQLRGYGPEVQAAALADLVSTWIAAWPKQARARQWSNFLDLVDDLTPIAGKTIFNADLVETRNSSPNQDGHAWAEPDVRRVGKS